METASRSGLIRKRESVRTILADGTIAGPMRKHGGLTRTRLQQVRRGALRHLVWMQVDAYRNEIGGKAQWNSIEPIKGRTAVLGGDLLWACRTWLTSRR